MNKFTVLLCLALANFTFAQYMIVGKDSISLQDFKKDNLYGLQNAGIEKTIKSTQDFLLLQQLAAEKRADTLAYFRQKVAQKQNELREANFFPQHITDAALRNYVNDSKTERNILIFSVEKKEDSKTDYRAVYNDVRSGKIKMEDAIKTHTGKEAQPIYIKPGVLPYDFYSEIAALQPGSYTTFHDNGKAVLFAKLVSTRPSLGYMVFGTIGIPDNAEGLKKKNEITAALKYGMKFQEVAAKFGTTDNEKRNGGVVMGSPTFPDLVYYALKGKNKGYNTVEPVKFGDQYFFFNIYDLIPYEITDRSKALFKKEMMESSFADKVQQDLIAELRKSSSYKETGDFNLIKKGYDQYRNFKNENAVLYSYNGKKMTFGMLKKEISEKFAELQGIPAQEWSQMLDVRRDNFIISVYSESFDKIPGIKKEIDQQKNILYSEYIFSEYLKKQVDSNPQLMKDYYEKNRAKFMWEERAAGRVAIIADNKLVDDVKKDISQIKNWPQLQKKFEGRLNEKNQILVHFEEGKMSKEADIFIKNNVPFKSGVHTAVMNGRTLVIAIDRIVPPTQMTQDEAKELIYDAVTDQKLQEIIAERRAKTRIVVEPAFVKDLEKNFKK